MKTKANKNKFWLVKSEADCYSIDDLKSDRRTIWSGVRNYQARNFLNEMQIGDQVLFYHSNAEPPGIAGVAKVVKTAAADPTQFDQTDDHFDPKSTRGNPRWFAPTLSFVQKFDSVISLAAVKNGATTKTMGVTQKGSRLSVFPVTEPEFNGILGLAEKIAA